MRFARTAALIGLSAFIVSGCITIVSLDQPYEAEAGKEFTTTVELRLAESGGEEEPETFLYGLLGFSVPKGWEITEVKTVKGKDIKPKWVECPDTDITDAPGYGGEGNYPWTYFISREKYSSKTSANMGFTIEVKIKPAAKGRFELGYASGTADGPGESGEYTSSWGANEVNGGSVVFKRIWVE
ncbi:MAG: hypothetical protein JSW52_08500 [Candidatus Coatesbacteria bacterium]|nr:MAG: hypothetical protein JSW52_08500 [Candidatus Coatesbacteria bacterium]